MGTRGGVTDPRLDALGAGLEVAIGDGGAATGTGPGRDSPLVRRGTDGTVGSLGALTTFSPVGLWSAAWRDVAPSSGVVPSGPAPLSGAGGVGRVLRRTVAEPSGSSADESGVGPF